MHSHLVLCNYYELYKIGIKNNTILIVYGESHYKSVLTYEKRCVITALEIF